MFRDRSLKFRDRSLNLRDRFLKSRDRCFVIACQDYKDFLQDTPSTKMCCISDHNKFGSIFPFFQVSASRVGRFKNQLNSIYDVFGWPQKIDTHKSCIKIDTQDRHEQTRLDTNQTRNQTRKIDTCKLDTDRHETQNRHAKIQTSHSKSNFFKIRHASLIFQKLEESIVFSTFPASNF